VLQSIPRVWGRVSCPFARAVLLGTDVALSCRGLSGIFPGPIGRRGQGLGKEEVGRLALSMESEYNALKARENAMLQAVNHYRDEAHALGKKEIQYSTLKREADSNQQLYDGGSRSVRPYRPCGSGDPTVPRGAPPSARSCCRATGPGQRESRYRLLRSQHR
jgi:hypothetical protein